jgi:hypothetical protein
LKLENGNWKLEIGNWRLGISASSFQFLISSFRFAEGKENPESRNLKTREPVSNFQFPLFWVPALDRGRRFP